ncbi:MAG: ADP-ribosylglycohydrolase family protein [Anaerolineae bacterium]|nr:ADP-ribosylglycohydrolase family protein [Anaerolineae bacterium]
MLGLAVGDAVGTTLEFCPPGSFIPIEDMLGGGPFRLRPGEWTDDTSMALCLAESLVAKRGFDPVDQLERYCLWYRTGHLACTGRCFDIGNTTRAALERFERTGDPYCGPLGPRTAGNGSLMRLAPVPLAYARHPRQAMDYSGESSRATHQARTAVDACRYFGGLIVGALAGVSKAELLSECYSPLAGYWQERPLTPEIDEVARGSFKVRRPPEIQGAGYVVRSLEAALWAFHHTDDFRAGCLAAANLGDDADTTAAVYGQLAGAFYGEEGIPAAWRARLAHRDWIDPLVEGLFELAQALPGEHDGQP